MKQENKKSKKWLLPLIIALAVLVVVVGVVLALVLPGQGQEPEGVSSKLYWNVDKTYYTENSETGLSTRTAADDGMFYVTFAVDGEQVELKVIGDKQLINYMDTMDVMGLTFDAEGVVVNVLDVKEIATVVAKDFYVRSASDTELVLNSSIAMNGMEQTVELSANTAIYNVDPANAKLVGEPGDASQMDKVSVYADAEGNVTHVYVIEEAVSAEIYWRVERCYDSATAMTTRVPDENGVYTILFACNGEQVELKCKDKLLVNQIDAATTLDATFAFVLDEEGYIEKSVSVTAALPGKEAADTFEIIEMDGSYISTVRYRSGKLQGQTWSGTVPEDCEIYLVCGNNTVENYIGEPTELQLGDQILCYTDLDDKPILIYVTRRMVDSPMYYNLSRKYSSTLGGTTRVPDENGWYVYEMAVDGKIVTLRTKDKAIADMVDKQNPNGMGLKLNGDVIEKVYHCGSVCGWTGAMSGRYINSLSGTIYSALHPTDFTNSVNGLVSADCKIYDLTGNYGIEKGAETTLQLGDCITAFKNASGELTHIYVTQRYVESAKLYYNLNRKYSGTLQETTREPDAEGYYVYEMLCDGKTVTVKTKSKAMATFIDAQAAPIVALEVNSSGIIKNAYTGVTAVQYGYKTANYNYVSKVNKDGTFNTYYYSNGERVDSTTTFTMADNCVIYNVSTNGYLSYRGEKTTLKVDDRIQAINTYPDKEITVIFVMERKFDSPLYWNTSRKYNSTTAETTREPDADGWYVFQLAVNGEVKEFKTKDKTVASNVDRATGAFSLSVDGNIIIQRHPAISARGVKALTLGRYDLMSISGDTYTFTRNLPLASDNGTTKELKLAKNFKAYDVSKTATSFGAETTLQLGDRVEGYTNDDGELVYAFVTIRNTHTAGHISYCEHCGKDVWWEPYDGSIYAADAHYYINRDMTANKQLTIGSAEANAEKYDIVLDLNGKTYTSKGRAMLLYDNLTVLDTVGGGKLEALNSSGGNGSVIMVTGGGTLNLYSGTLTPAEGATSAKSGGVVFVGSNSTFNMYGGTVTGGVVKPDAEEADSVACGGNVYISGSVFNLYGGTISGGIAEGTGSTGGNVFISIGATFNMTGGSITGGEAEKGGGVAISGTAKSKATATITGGTISGGTAFNGGNLYLTHTNTSLSTTVTGGIAQDITVDETVTRGTGGNAYVTSGAVLTINDGAKITDGKAYYTPGIRLAAGTVVMNGGTVSNTESCYRGGNFYLSGASALTINGGTVSGGTATDNGGNIYSNNPSAVITLNGGTICDGSANNGGNVHFDNGSTLIVNGGAISGGTATGLGGTLAAIGRAATVTVNGGTISDGSIYMTGKSAEEPANLTISGGNISGGVQAGSLVNVTLSGAPVVSGDGLSLGSGILAQLGEMTDGAQVSIAASGAFTVENEKAESYAGYFQPANACFTVSCKDNVLYCEVDYTAPLAFVEDTTDAYCAACGKVVTWTALDQATYGESGYGILADNAHVYLAEDITYTGSSTYFIMAPGERSSTEGKVACLHLNGKNLTAVNYHAINGSSGILNIMGSGTVSGNRVNGNYGTTIYMNNNREMGTINLYSGTYTKVEGNTQAYVASVMDNGGKIVVHEAAKLVGGVYFGAAKLRSATFEVNGGTVEGNITMVGAAADKGNVSTFVMNGGCVTGTVDLAANNGCVLSGAPTVGTLALAEGVKITLGELVEGAAIVVSANGAFTEANDNAESYKEYFQTASSYVKLSCKDNVLYCKKDFVSDLAFEGDTNKAYCPVCEEVVEWTAITMASNGTTAIGEVKTSGTHLYLAEDITYSGSDTFIQAPNANKTACLHLNGNDLTTTQARVINGYPGVLNVMGSGTVSGNYVGSTPYQKSNAAAIHMNTTGVNGTLNLYSGTYTKPATNTTNTVVVVHTNGGTINVYEDATIDGQSAGAVAVYNGYFNLCGGKVTGGDVKLAVYSSGKTGTMTMTGGEAQSISVSAGSFTLSGASKIGTLTLAADVKIALGELETGAAITVSANGVFAETENAADYEKYFTAVEGFKITAEGNTLKCEEDTAE